MAHKHNRRRVRHRTRRNRYEQNLPTLHESISDSFSSLCDESTFASEFEPPRPIILLSHGLSNAATLQRTWLDTNTPDRRYGRNHCPPMYVYPVSKEDIRNMRTFGGEPGEGPDEADLCGKMQEMFDSMEWMNT